MDGPRTHYQLSFTSRQALWLFVSLLASLAVAFFFGVMAGLAGRPEAPGPAAVAATAGDPTVTDAEPAAEPPPAASDGRPSRTRVAGDPVFPRASAGAAPPARLETFDDRVPAEAARPMASPAREPEGERFWVQVLSSSSEKEAAARKARLSAGGFPASIVPGTGPRGPLFRVRLGPYSSREEASKAAARVRATEKVEPWIVPAGS